MALWKRNNTRFNFISYRIDGFNGNAYLIFFQEITNDYS